MIAKGGQLPARLVAKLAAYANGGPDDVAKLSAWTRSINAARSGGAPQEPCLYCQAGTDEWCEYDCGSPFPVVHPENRAGANWGDEDES